MFPMRQKLHLVIAGFVSLIVSIVFASAQETTEPNKESAVMMRIICNQPVEGATALKIAQGSNILQDLTIIPSLVTDPVAVKRGELSLAKWTGSDKTLVLNPVVKITIPDAGTRFVLALFPSPDPEAAAPYRHLLIRTDGLNFKASDLYLHNLTSVPVAGLLGKTKFQIAPAKSTVVTPTPEPAGERMYQAQFYFQREGEAFIFNDTRWPLASSARVYLFFIPDPVRQSMGYVSFREYSPFP
jgi:hypothetical protein